MAFTGEGIRLTGFKAGADLSACQYTFVRSSATAGQILAATAGCAVAPIGVLLNSPSSGQAAEIMLLGVTPLWCNGGTAINEGDNIICNASSYGSVMTTASGASNARAVEALASGCGLINVIVFPVCVTTSGDDSP